MFENEKQFFIDNNGNRWQQEVAGGHFWLRTLGTNQYISAKAAEHLGFTFQEVEEKIHRYTYEVGTKVVHGAKVYEKYRNDLWFSWFETSNYNRPTVHEEVITYMLEELGAWKYSGTFDDVYDYARALYKADCGEDSFDPNTKFYKAYIKQAQEILGYEK